MAEQQQNIEVMLARIDERTKQLVEDIKVVRSDSVTRAEFEAKLNPIRLIAYGLVAVVLTAVIGSIVLK